MDRFVAHWLGRAPYEPTRVLQEKLVTSRHSGTIGNTLLLLEHDPVITLGRRANAEHVLESREALARRGIEVCETTARVAT